jgi:neutral ceramidase
LGSAASSSSLPDIPTGPSPPINTNNSLSFITGVVYDEHPIGKSFGQATSNPDNKTYSPGDTVSTTFVGANPRNNLRQESTYAAVERKDPSSGDWKVVRNDRDWNLVFSWERTNLLLGYSDVTISWQIEDDYYSVDDPNPVQSGTYRMHYYGESKSALGEISSFDGIGGTFMVST